MSEGTASAAAMMTGQGETTPPADSSTGNAEVWYGDLSGETRDWVELKGWKDQQSAMESARSLEKLLGADRAGRTVVMPKDGESWDVVYDKLGRPESADGYKFDTPEGRDEIAQWFRKNAHEAGLNNDQASKMFNEFVSMTDAMGKQDEESFNAQVEADLKDLKKEWGLAFDQHIQAGRNAAQRFGFTPEEIEGIESVIGTKATLQRMAAIGKGFGEDRFESGDRREQSFGMTPGAAQQQIKDLQIDKQFMAAYLDPSNPGNKAAQEKMARLHQAAYPGGE